MSQRDSICAVVVTYHPDAEAIENLAVTLGEVDHLVVVDNGATGETLRSLREASLAGPFTLIENGDNLGIAVALNRGVRWAKENSYSWVLLFDQDSQVTPDFGRKMLEGFRGSLWGERLAILVPQYVDKRSGEVIPQPPIVDGSIEQATTSGSLMPMAVFDRFGLFREELFIDGVDYEYSLRVRAEGLGIEECQSAVLLHAPGSPTHHTLFGKRYQASNHIPVRRYYQERNKVLMLKVYGARFPRFFVHQFTISAKDFFKLFLVEQGKAKKIRYFLRGLWDGLLGRSGRFAGH